MQVLLQSRSPFYSRKEPRKHAYWHDNCKYSRPIIIGLWTIPQWHMCLAKYGKRDSICYTLKRQWAMIDSEINRRAPYTWTTHIYEQHLQSRCTTLCAQHVAACNDFTTTCIVWRTCQVQTTLRISFPPAH